MVADTQYYDLLNLNPECAEEEVRISYYKLARKYHPDKNKDIESKQKFADIKIAYDTLSDASKRKIYDRFGVNGPPTEILNNKLYRAYTTIRNMRKIT